MRITEHDFMLMQPNKGHRSSTDQYYHQLACRLAGLWESDGCFLSLPERARRAVVLAVVGYFQDIVADAGLWRSFTMMHNHLYGKPLPFYERADDYIDYELNRDDLRFLIWYTLDGMSLQNFLYSPLNRDIEWLANLFFAALDEVYEQAPTPIELSVAVGVDPTDVEDAGAIYDLSRWLFFDSYLMKPAAKAVLARMLLEAREIMKREQHDRESKLDDLQDRTMLSATTGPLQLSIGQWVELIATGKIPEIEPMKEVEALGLPANMADDDLRLVQRNWSFLQRLYQGA